MSFEVRRVVTGHDNDEKAVVLIDEIKPSASAWPGAHAVEVWTTEGFPVNNEGSQDEGKRQTGTTLDNGTVFRIVRYDPGVSARNHRTDAIDYAVVMSGEIDTDLDGAVVDLKAGAVLVQRGNIHNCFNRGTEPCVIAVSLIAAKPVTAGGKDASCARLSPATPRQLDRRLLELAAFARWVARGGAHAGDLDDWSEAVRYLMFV
jgi:hypothetical protein